MAFPTVTDTTELGPTNYQARVQAGALVGETLYVITYRQEPVHVAAYDLATRRVTDHWEVPVSEFSDSPGAWNLVAYDDRYLYSVMGGPTDLYRFDLETETFEFLHRFPDVSERTRDSKAIEVRDDRLFLSTKNDPVLFEYEHASDELREIAPAHPTAQKAHDLAIGEESVYVGGGPDAYVAEIDPETGDRRALLPPALADENFVQSVDLTPDGRLVIGTSERLAVIDPAGSPEAATIVEADYEVEYSGGAMTALHATDTAAYVTTCDPSYGIWTHEFGTETLEPIAAPINHPTRDIFEYDGELVGVGSGGYSAVWTCNPEKGETSTTLLGDVGLPRGPGNVQSLRAMGDDVYAGGSRTTGVHHVSAGTFDQFQTAGEPKVMRGVRGRIYQGVYGGAGVVEYDPETGNLRELAWIGKQQNRPRAMHVHDATGYLLVGTRPDYGRIGGAIAAYDLAADELVSVDRNAIEHQTINAVTSIDDTVYLGTEIDGGIGVEPVTRSARVGAWDPVARERLWELTPFEDAEKIRGLTVLDGLVYGQASGRRLFAVDPDEREVVLERTFGGGRSDSGSAYEGMHQREVATGDLRAWDGQLFGVTHDCLFAYDPEIDRIETLLDDLAPAPGWHNFPQLAIDDSGRMYVVRGKQLLQVTLDG